MHQFIASLISLIATIVFGCHHRNKVYSITPTPTRIIGQSIPRAAYNPPARGDSQVVPLFEGRTPRVQSDAWANEQFQRMNELYEQFRYDECLAVAQALIQYPNVCERRRASVFVTEGAVFFLQGRYGEARQAFYQAHRLDPGFRINRRYFSPELVRCFESSR